MPNLSIRERGIIAQNLLTAWYVTMNKRYMLLDAFPLIRRYGAITALMIGFCCAALLAYQDHLHAWSVAPHVTLVKLFIFYASLLTVPWTLFFVYRLIYRSSLVDLCCVILGVFGIYSRLLEPNLMAVYHTNITLNPSASKQINIALISDLHVGLFSRTAQLEHVVQRINHESIDLVIIAGDFSYETPRHQIKTRLLPLAALKAPTFAVLGNHDEQAPGPAIGTDLRRVLQTLHIQVIEQQNINYRGLDFYGTGDLWGGMVNFDPLTAQSSTAPVVVVAHHPDTLQKLAPLSRPVLMLSGHTHGGQIHLPWITQSMLNRISVGGYQRGLYQTQPHRQLFVTSGIGMIGLPFRFAMPPAIDILHIHYTPNT